MAIKRIVLNHPYPPEEAAANVENLKQLHMRGSNVKKMCPWVQTLGAAVSTVCACVLQRVCWGVIAVTTHANDRLERAVDL